MQIRRMYFLFLFLLSFLAYTGHSQAADLVWVEDSPPAGSTLGGTGDRWVWVSANPSPISGSLAHQSAVLGGMHQHFFYNTPTANRLSINAGDTLFTYVYLDPTNPPSEIMLAWNSGAGQHRAYWGANSINLGVDGTASRRYMGALPPVGQWVRLEVPANQVGLEGSSLHGMAFALYNGRATWDRAGKSSSPSGSNIPPLVNLSAPTNNASYTAPATITLNANATDSDGSISQVEFYHGGTLINTDTSAPYSYTWSNVPVGSYNLTARAIDNTGAVTASTPITVTVRAVAGTDLVWVEDSPPSGSIRGGTGEGWVWVSANPSPHSGSLAHQSAVLGGMHQHFFYNTPTANRLSINAGDTLFTYVYLDPTNPPSEIMLAWNSGAGQHRAYWGANSINLGVDGTASRRYMGALPPVGQWVRLEVPANQVGLEGSSLHGMAFALYNGRATWDRAGKSSSPSGSNIPPLVNLNAPTNNASYTAPATITLNANATDSDGSISQVEFYNGGTLINTDTSAPYSYTWSNVPVGSYNLTARATDNTGASTTSTVVNVSVIASAPSVSISANPTTISSGGSSTLTWSSSNATSCTASGGWSGSKATSGNQLTGALTATSSFVLTCTGVGGSASQTAGVTVTAVGGGFVPPYPLPAPGQAVALGTQTAQAIRPASHDAGAWQYTLFDSYGGGVLMPSFSRAGAYAIAGTGGHNSSEHTGGVVFNFETGTWQLLTDASGTPARMNPYYVADTNGSPEYEIAVGATTPNAVPAPPHPYMNLMPLPSELGGGPLGSLVYAIQSAQASESVTSTRAHRFDLSTRTWSRYTSNHLNSLGGVSAGHDAPSVYDPTAKRIWQLPTQIHQTQNIGYIDLTEASPQWRLSASWPWTPTWDGTHSAWLDDTRRLILMQSPTRLVALDLNNLTAGPRILNFSGTLPPSGNRWEFYPPDGSFYNKGNTGNEVWKLTPPVGNPLTGTWAITSFIVSGATLPEISPSAQLYGARHFTRFFYVPSIAAFAWIADSYSPVMLIRPPVAIGTPVTPTVSISATPSAINSGGATTLAWSSTNATSCTASGAWSGARAPAGAEGINALSATSTYTLTCTGAGGSTSQSVTVTVTPGTPAPTVSLNANPVNVSNGGASTLSWSSTNATSCTASGAWSGSKATGGTQTTGALSTPSTYTLSCTGAGGNASQSVSINVGTGTPPSPIGVITSVQMVNNSSGNQTNAPVTFGHAFKQGDVPAGFTVIAKDSAGNAVALQVDKKATHADGSLRHAILTANLANLPAAVTQTLNLHTQSDSASASAVSLANLLTTSFDSQVSLNVAGVVYTATARNLLQTTTPKSWLAGPEVSEWIVGGPVKTASGVAHPHLTAYFHVRAYAGTPITKVRVDAVVENNWTFKTGATAFTYIPAVTVGSTTIYSNGGANLAHSHHTRWHQVGWWNNTDSKIFVKPDTRYLRDSRAVPNYASVAPQESLLNGYTQSVVPLTVANLRPAWNPGGAHAQIGLMPEWYASYVMSNGDVRAYNAVLANDSAGGAFSYHYRDENTGLPVSIDTYPNISEQDPSSLVLGAGGNPNQHDGEHAPLIGYLGYLLTGDYYYLEELQFLANWRMFHSSAGSREFAKGILTGGNRDMAWAMRTIAAAAAIIPDESVSLKSYFSTKLNNNIDDRAVKWSLPATNTLGAIKDDVYPVGYYAPWQMDFFVSVINWTAELGFNSSNTLSLRNWVNKWPTGRMGQDNSGYCPYYAALYNFGDDVSDRGIITLGGVYRTFAQLYQYKFPAESAQPCPTSGVMRVGYGNVNTVDYYSNVLQPALAMAVDSGVATQATWSKFLSIAPADYSLGGTWGIVPRSSGSATVPNVTLVANPSQVVSGGSTSLSWVASNAVSCTAPWTNSQATSGSQTIANITSATTYSMTCTGAGGSSTQAVTVSVGTPTPASPTVTFSADTLSVAYNASTTLRWTSTNAASCTASGAWSGSKAISGSQMLANLTATGTYTLTCTGTGGSIAQSTTITVNPVSGSPLTVGETAILGNNDSGNGGLLLAQQTALTTSATLQSLSFYVTTASGDLRLGVYDATGPNGGPGAKKAETNSITPVAGWNTVNVITPVSLPAGTYWLAYTPSSSSLVFKMEPSGSAKWYAYPYGPMPATFSATPISGPYHWSLYATFNTSSTPTPTPLPTVTFSANPISVSSGGASTLTWSSTNATSCTASGAWSGSKAVSGNQSTGVLSTSSSYTLTCTGAGGSASQSAAVTVTSGTSAPTVTLSTNPTSVLSGGSSTLTWSSTNATSCTASGAWSGSKAISGNQSTGVLSANSSFTLTCTGAGGSSSRSAAVSVTPVGGSPLDSVQPGQWYMVPNSNVSALDPCPARNCSYSGVGGQSELITAWNGGAYDTTRDRLLIWGGGHNDYGGNEIYAFDIASMAWTMVIGPSAITAADRSENNATNYYSDGRPSSRHSGSALVYAANVDQFFSMAAGATYGDPAGGGFNVDSFNFNTNAWKTNWTQSPGNGTNSTIAAYHPGTGKIWFHASMNSPLAVFDPAANGGTTPNGTGGWTSYGSQYLEIYSTPIIDTKRNRYIAMGGYAGARQLFVWDLNNPNSAPTTPATSGVPGGLALEAAQAPGFVYDPVGDRYIAWHGGTTVYALDPVTWVWSVVSLHSGNTVTPTGPNLRGSFGRMQYVPSKNAFVVVNNTTENVYFFKLSSPGSIAAPTVSLNTSPSSVASGGSSTLSWSSTNATSCTASGAWSGSKAVSGNQSTGVLSTSSTYTLTCTGAGGSASRSVTVTVTPGTPAPTVTLNANPTSVASGGSSTLNWSSTNATSCTSSGAWSGSKAISGNQSTGVLSTSSSYTLTCTGAGGSASQSAAVSVTTVGGFVPPYPLPAPGQAIALGSHTAEAIRPAPYSSSSWQYSLFDSYGGGVLVPWFSNAGAYVMAGTGGHNHPDFTGGVAFDFQTGIWKLLPDASGTLPKNIHPHAYTVSDTNGAPEYEINLPDINGLPNPNFVPSPPHPYANLMPLPPELGGGPLGSVVYPIQGAQAQESRTSSRSHRFDLSTRTWSRFTSNHLGALNTRLADSDAPSVYDPTAKRIWQMPVQIHSTQTIGYIDLTEASPQWRLSASWPYVSTWDSTHSAWLDDARRLILMQSPTRLVALDLNNLAAGPRLLNFTGTLPPSGNRWELYPLDGNFYYKSYAGNVLWKLKPPAGDPITGTWSVTSFTVGGATLPSISDAAQASGVRHYTRFFYVPSIASFAWMADSTSPVHLIRPPTDSSPTPTPTPLVTLAASSTSVASNGSSTLVWSSTNATSCISSGAWPSASKIPVSGGSELLNGLTATGTYVLTCTGASGSTVQASVTINVGASAVPRAITAVSLVNTSGATQTNPVVTLGHAFKAGDVPSGNTVGAKRADGSVVTLQVDKKATHADGSVRHAILTARLASLGGSSSEILTLYTQPDSPAGSPITPGNLPASFDAQVSLNLGGTVYSASAKELLASTTPKVWLSGLEVSEWIVGGPVKAGGIAHPHLTAYFHIRAYAGSPITKVRVDAVVENNWTFKAGATSFTYVPTVTVGGTTIYNNGGSNLTHYHHTRWHQVGWWNNTDSKIFVKPDTRYLRDSKAVPNYASVTPQENLLNGYTQSVVPMKVANLRSLWSPGGAHPQIGLMPEWYASYVMSDGDIRAYNAVLANDSAGGAFSYHYRDENTGLPVSIDTYPNIGEQDAISSGLVLGTGGNPNQHDGEHQPLIGYLAYLLTGDYYYLEEVQFLANWGMLWRSAGSRGGSDGIIGGGGSPTGNREIAWAVRTQAAAGAITPSESVALKAYFVGKANNNFDKMATEWGATSPNTLGIRLDIGYSDAGYYAPWQMDFLVSVVNFAVDLGYASPNSITLRNTFNKWPTGRMGQDNSGYCPYYAALYNFGNDVSDRGVISGGVYRTFAQLYQYKFPVESAQPCPTSGVMRVGYGGVNAVDYYSNTMQPALAMAVDSGVATQATWSKFLSIAPADYSLGGTWAIVPRP